MTPTDVYAPWREQLAALEARHVGRKEELHLLERTVRKFIAGDGATHLYLFGPRGTGKSHLLALVEKRLRPEVDAANTRILVVPEDIAEHRKASYLLARIEQFGVEVTAFGRRAKPAAPATPDQRPRVILMEGFDRQLGGMSKTERRALRAGLLRDGPPTLLIATGIGLTEALTGANEAFFGALLPRPLSPLNADEAARLLDAAAGADIAARDRRWGARKPTLLALAGGSPRTLIALGIVSANNPDDDASERLFQVMNAFTAHYQLTFRDLPPQGQRIVEVLAAAPAAMTPTELAEMLGDTPSATSVVCNRLMNDGALSRESEGKSSYYRLPEPLFRYWLEYRNLPWEHTRVGMLSRLVEAVYSPDEVAALWLEQRGAMLDAMEEIYRRNEEFRGIAFVKLAEQFVGLAKAGAWKRFVDLGDRLGTFPDAGNIIGGLYVLRALLDAPCAVLEEILHRHRHCLPDEAVMVIQFAVDLDNEPTSALERLASNFQHQPAGRVHVEDSFYIAITQTAIWLHPVNRLLQRLVAGTSFNWDVGEATRSLLPRIPGIRGLMSRDLPGIVPRLVTASEIASIGLRAFEPDFDDLLCLSLQHRCVALFDELCSESRLAFVSSCVEPTTRVPVRPTFVRILLSTSSMETTTTSVLSWLATLADYPDEAFEPILSFLATATLESEPEPQATLALLDLQRNQRSRYDRVRAAVTDDKLHAFLDTIDDIAAQLDGPPEAHLHPELAHFRALLDAPPRRLGDSPA